MHVPINFSPNNYGNKSVNGKLQGKHISTLKQTNRQTDRHTTTKRQRVQSTIWTKYND